MGKTAAAAPTLADELAAAVDHAARATADAAAAAEQAQSVVSDARRTFGELSRRHMALSFMLLRLEQARDQLTAEPPAEAMGSFSVETGTEHPRDVLATWREFIDVR